MPIKLGEKSKLIPYQKAYLNSTLIYKKNKWVLVEGEYIPKLAKGDIDTYGNYTKNGIAISYIVEGATEARNDLSDMYKCFDKDDLTYFNFGNTKYKDCTENIILDLGKNIRPVELYINFKYEWFTTGSTELSILLSKDDIIYDTIKTYKAPNSTASEWKINEVILMNLEEKYRFIKIKWGVNPNDNIGVRNYLYTLQLKKWYEEE